jgi:hypothetical protein
MRHAPVGDARDGSVVLHDLHDLPVFDIEIAFLGPGAGAAQQVGLDSSRSSSSSILFVGYVHRRKGVLSWGLSSPITSTRPSPAPR